MFTDELNLDMIDDDAENLTSDPPISTVKKFANLSECLHDTFELLAPFRLTEEENQIIQEFLTFRWRTRLWWNIRPEVRKTYYNLLVQCDENETIRHVAEILRDALSIPASNSLFITELDLLKRLENANRAFSRMANTPIIDDGTKFLLIYDCQEMPRLDVDGGSAARTASAKAIEQYQIMWKYVFNLVRQSPDMVLIVCGSHEVYRSSLRPHNELSCRICAHHLELKSRTVDDLLQDCLAQLERSTFALSDGFKDTLCKYFHSAYRSSELKGRAFVDDVIRQIYALYFSRPYSGKTLTDKCVPGFDPRAQSVAGVLGQLNDLVGLEAVKDEFKNIYTMQLAGLVAETSHRYHMLFAGNPGTGKTTVARMAADLFFRMGVIKTNKLVIVKPSDMVSEWIGGTGTKAMEVIRRAYNGVLFIDEAYSIANMDRGHELLNILIQEMENNSDRLIVIFAGYTDEMRTLLQKNPGLGSRIARQIQFDDYSLEELVQIFLMRCKKDGFTLHPSAQDELEDCISALMTREFFGNARDVENMLQDLKESWSEEYYEKLTKHSTEDTKLEKVFYPHHFDKIMPPKKEISINDLIGLDTLKAKLEVFKKQALYQKFLREKGFTSHMDFSMHMIFTGNPGTGKTSVAKLIADDLYSIGMLKTNRLVVTERKDLISNYGDTGKKAADVIRKAVGGVLFVDEAYSLADGRRSGLGNEVIEVFLTAMEEHKSDTVFIFAGYVDEMQEFIAMNPGIQSRIGYTFHFEDYSAEELTRMFTDKMHKTGFEVSDDAVQKVRDIMEYFHGTKNFGNGRFVNHVIHQTITQRANRDFTEHYRSITGEDIPSIKTLIETAPNNMHLYDPAIITDEERRRTAVHELGHALVMVATDPKNVPESISIRNHAESLGRVRQAEMNINLTEQQLMNHLATLLGGKNAEKLIFGSHSTGCSNDYTRAKRVAQNMIDNYAMTQFGESVADILKAADKLSMDIIQSHQHQLDIIADTLLKQMQLSGQEFMTLLDLKQA